MELKRSEQRVGRKGNQITAIGQQGLLLERSQLLKNWEQRWFLLDSVKHQVGGVVL